MFTPDFFKKMSEFDEKRNLLKLAECCRRRPSVDWPGRLIRLAVPRTLP